MVTDVKQAPERISESFLLPVQYLGLVTSHLRHLERERQTPSTCSDDPGHKDDLLQSFAYGA